MTDIDTLRALAYELHVPLTNEIGGYGEIVIRRATLADDAWLITDGATTNARIWIDGDWRPYSDYGIRAAHCYTLDQAITEARQVAEYEGAAFEAHVRATAPGEQPHA